MRVLGIETSCDETGVALYEDDQGLVWERLYSQVQLHRAYGGVVPELASRDHLVRLPDLLQQALSEAPRPDVVAYTAGPGLVGALLVGATIAEGFAAARGLPIIAVNHLEAHLLAPLMREDAPGFPFIVLLVSGGHTLLIEARSMGSYRILGTSLDDAAGEAFDKTASLLGLEYPGGPALSRLAQNGKPGRFHLPRPLLDRAGYDFSFSGLKTAALYASQSMLSTDHQGRADLAREFEQAVVDTLVQKSLAALKDTKNRTLVVAGGVAANQTLRAQLTQRAFDEGVRVFFPPPALCTDNGAMVAYAGWRRARAGLHPSARRVRARWPLNELSAA